MSVCVPTTELTKNQCATISPFQKNFPKFKDQLNMKLESQMRIRTESTGPANAGVIGRQNSGGNSSNAYQVNAVSACRNVIKCIQIIIYRNTIQMQKCHQNAKTSSDANFSGADFWVEIKLGD